MYCKVFGKLTYRLGVFYHQKVALFAKFVVLCFHDQHISSKIVNYISVTCQNVSNHGSKRA